MLVRVFSLREITRIYFSKSLWVTPQPLFEGFYFMAIHFGDEHLQFHKGVHAVYRVVINDRWFYIGSSVDIKRRLSGWKNNLSNPMFSKNTSIKFLLPTITAVRFEIIEFVPENINPKERENVYLEQHFQDPLCLNLTPDAINSRGRKVALGQIKKEKKVLGIPTQKKPVAQFTITGQLIKVHSSILEASAYSGAKTDTIRKSFKNKAIAPRKFIFKPVSPTGDFIEPTYTKALDAETVRYIVANYTVIGGVNLAKRFGLNPNYIRMIARGQSRKSVICESYPESMEAKPKKVTVIGLNGEELGTYESTGKAARSVGLKTSHVQDVLHGRRNHSKGYKFKYA